VADYPYFRPTVTIELLADEPYTFPKLDPTNVKETPPTISKGDSEVRVEYWHNTGNDPRFHALLAAGLIRAVCREHVFIKADYHCRNCGHNRDTAKAAGHPFRLLGEV